MNRRQFLKVGAGSGAALFASSLPFSAAVWAKVLNPNGLDGATVSEFMKSPPFSFVYGERASSALLAQWPRQESRSRSTSNSEQITVAWTDPKTRLEVRWVATIYPGFSTLSWTVYFTNRGSSRTPMLTDVLAVDWALTDLDPGRWTIHSNNGSAAQPTDFAPYEIPLEANSFRVFTTRGGRSSNGYHNADLRGSNVGGGWPYVNVEWNQGGVVVALGWPGQWVMEVKREGATTLQVFGAMNQLDGALLKPGQDIFATNLTALWLAAGETIRSPRVVAMPWTRDSHAGIADWLDAQNLWRQWFMQHHMPRKHGNLPDPLCPAAANGFFAEQGGPDGPDNQADELSWLNAYGEEKDTRATGGVHNYWWIDAGWYETPPGPVTWVSTGTWRPSPTRFPHGLKPVFSRARQLGMGAILWFEPERVMPGTWLYDYRSEWLLRPPPGFPEYSGQARLLNFGNPEVRTWAVDHFSALIASQGVNIYREDYNIDPLAYWQFNDPPGRRGITQIRYVEGHLAYWKGLLERHPDLLIDACASGGRRLDVETMGYAINLWRSDYANVAEANQGMTYGVSPWLPLTGDMVLIQSFAEKGTNAYNARSAMAPSFQEVVQVPSAVTENWEVLRSMSFEWLDIAKDYFGDFYPLTDYAVAEDTTVWIAWQFDQPARGTGFVQAFRRSDNKEATMTLILHGLSSSAQYRLFDYESQKSWTASGGELSQRGVNITLKTGGSATTIRYSRL